MPYQASKARFELIVRPGFVAFAGLLLGFLAVQGAAGADAVVRFDPIPGKVFLGGGAMSDEDRRAFIESIDSEEPGLVVLTDSDAEQHAATAKRLWREAGGRRVDVFDLDAAERDTAAPVKAIAGADAVWLELRTNSDAPSLETLSKAIREAHERGTVVGASGFGAMLLFSHAPDHAKRPTAPIGLIPSAALFIDEEDSRNGQPKAIAGIVALHLQSSGRVIVSGRRIRAADAGDLTIALAASKTRPPLVTTIGDRRTADLIALQRAAHARTQPPFPESIQLKAHVPHGTLIIVGGGVPTEVYDRFIQEAGGKRAPIVIVPTAIGGNGSLRTGERVARVFAQHGAENVRVLHAPWYDTADTEENLTKLKDAGGVWFTGGRQWRLVDSYENTKVENAFHDVLKRGGVIGGSSAGATIQGEYLVRGNPLGNWDMMAEGYERGFGFIRNVAIDQHFSQRNRFKDLESVKKRFPNLVGFGIDEMTAVVAKGDRLEIIGRGSVAIYDRSLLADKEKYTTLAAGDRYDLTRKRKIETSE